MYLYRIIFIICGSAFLGLSAKQKVNLSDELTASMVSISKQETEDKSRDLLNQIHAPLNAGSSDTLPHNLTASLHVKNPMIKQNNKYNDLELLNNFLKNQVNPEYQKALQILTNDELEKVYIQNIEMIRNDFLNMSAEIMKKSILNKQKYIKRKNLSLQLVKVNSPVINNANTLVSKKKNLLHLLSTG